MSKRPSKKNADVRCAFHPIKYGVFFTSAFSVVLATSIIHHVAIVPSAVAWGRSPRRRGDLAGGGNGSVHFV